MRVALALKLAKSDDVKAVAYAMIVEQRDWSLILSIEEDTDLILVNFDDNEVWICLSTTICLNDVIKLAKVDYSIPGWNMVEGD